MNSLFHNFADSEIRLVANKCGQISSEIDKSEPNTVESLQNIHSTVSNGGNYVIP